MPGKFSHRMRLLRSYLGRENVCPGLPPFVTISPTSRCNLACPMCPRAISEFSNTDIAWDTFEKILAEGAPYFQFVYLMGGGEPFLNPDLFKMIGRCRDNGLRTGLSTNATLLRGARVEEVFESGLDYIILAFDGTTAEVYEKYRPGARFEITRDNILRFVESKIKRRSRIRVTVQMVRLPDNRHQVDDFQTMWDIRGINDIRIKEDEIGVSGVGLLDETPLAPRKNPCHFLWQGPPFIDESGDVYPCCYMWRSRPVGNIRHESLQSIWNNEDMQSLRDAHITGKLGGYRDCLECRAPRPRLPLIIGSFLVDTFQVRRMIPFMERVSLLHRLKLFEDK